MKIIAGLPFQHEFDLSGYSSDDGWVVTGKLANTSVSDDLASGLFTPSGSDWTLDIPSSTTTGYVAGNRTLYLIATADSLEELVYQSPIVIEALGTVSHAQKMVTALQALMEGRADKAYESFTTPDGESITRLDPEKLRKWLAHYEIKLGAELHAAAGGGRIKRIQMEFK